jgi:tripartite-type tricarboxylate transporter receptor subunit TctC
MKLPHRRQFLHLTASAAALPVVATIAKAQAYPTRPVRIVVGFAPGGPNDINARLISQWLSERLGQQFIVDNRPGAAGNIAMESVVKSPPDGYTLVMVATSSAANATLYDNLAFNFLRDIAPVGGISRTYYVMLVHPSVPARTGPELLALAKANPGKLNMASPGSGTGAHMASELFKLMTGISMVHVPYRGSGPMLAGLLGGQVQFAFDTIFSSIEHIRSGGLRALGVSTTTRSELLADIPTVAEFVPGYEASTWFGVGAPKSTSAATIDKLNSEINAGLADPKMRARIADLGGTVLTVSPAEFGNLIAADTEKWGKVIRAANIKPE